MTLYMCAYARRDGHKYHVCVVVCMCIFVPVCADRWPHRHSVAKVEYFKVLQTYAVEAPTEFRLCIHTLYQNTHLLEPVPALSNTRSSEPAKTIHLAKVYANSWIYEYNRTTLQ